MPGVVRGFDIDTNWFTGNFAPAASVEGYLAEPGRGELVVDCQYQMSKFSKKNYQKLNFNRIMIEFSLEVTLDQLKNEV